MYQSLLAIKGEFTRLNALLQTKEVLEDIKRYTSLTKEINKVSKIVEVFDDYLTLEKDFSEAKDILATSRDEELISFAKNVIEQTQGQINDLENILKLLLIPQDENDDKDVIVEIRGAAGGDEGNIFAGDLFDIYKKYANLNAMEIQLLEANKGESGGYTLLVFRVKGHQAYSKLKYESGVHRVQRVPLTETQGRVHTSTATVIVMPEADASIEIEIKPSDVKIDTFRSSGAGGQSVNTTDSAVRVTHLATGIVVSSQNGRSQVANREEALQILKTKLYNLEVEKKHAESATFRALGGTGARSEKIRTYNYPQDRVTDHRISFSTSLKSVVEGKLNLVIEALVAADQAERISNANL